jgi:hypothetical protein
MAPAARQGRCRARCEGGKDGSTRMTGGTTAKCRRGCSIWLAARGGSSSRSRTSLGKRSTAGARASPSATPPTATASPRPASRGRSASRRRASFQQLARSRVIPVPFLPGSDSDARSDVRHSAEGATGCNRRVQRVGSPAGAGWKAGREALRRGCNSGGATRGRRQAIGGLGEMSSRSCAGRLVSERAGPLNEIAAQLAAVASSPRAPTGRLR